MDLSKKTDRRTAKPSTKVYTQTIQRSLALQWLKSGELHATWSLRWYTGSGYKKERIGFSDEILPADNTIVFSFDQAAEAARQWVRNRILEASGDAPKGYTVADAGRDWIAQWTGSEAGKKNAEGNLKWHINPVLGKIPLAKLRREKVQHWLYDLAKKPPVKSTMQKSKKKFDPTDPETIRKRRDTANRIYNDLSAMLTLAYENGKVASKAAWDTVKKFENVGIAKNEYLTQEEAKKLLEVCQPDFRNLVSLALIAGNRYMDIARRKVSDYDPVNRSISLKRQGKTGKANYVYLTDEENALLSELVRGKNPDDLILSKADGTPWKKSNQQPRMKAALKAAGINRHVRFHDTRHTFGTLLVMNGVPLNLVANQLGHSSVRMAERFYAHYSPDYIAAEVRSKKPSIIESKPKDNEESKNVNES